MTKRIAKSIGLTTIMLCLMVAFMPTFGGGAAYAKSSVKLNKKTVYIAKGSSYTLKVKGTKSKVKWKSSDKKIATVSSKGKVKAKAIGSCKVTAKVKGKKLTCKVVVESKAANKARKLRDYILKSGKKSGGKYYIKKTKKSDDNEGTTETTQITANKKNKTLEFYYSRSTAEPPETTSEELVIDLISGTDPVKSGSFVHRWIDGYSEDCDNVYTADVTTAFRNLLDSSEAKVEGMNLKDYTLYNDSGSVVEEITDAAVLNTGDKYMRPAAYGLSGSFSDWDKLIKSKSTLKKAKITMKSMGFSNY